MRVRDLAKELNVSNQDILAVLKEQGIEVTNYMSAIDASQAKTVRDVIEGKGADSGSSDTTVKRVGAKVIRRRKVIKKKPVVEEVATEDAVVEDPAEAASAPGDVSEPAATSVKDDIEEDVADESGSDAVVDTVVDGDAAGEDAVGTAAVSEVAEKESVPSDAMTAASKDGARIVGTGVKIEQPARPTREPRRPSASGGPTRPAASREGRDMPAANDAPRGKKKKVGDKTAVRHPKRRVVTKTDKYRHIFTDGTRNLRASATRKKKKGGEAPTPSTVPMSDRKRKIRIEESILVGDLAKQMGVKSSDIVKKFFEMGTMVTVNQTIDPDTAAIIAADYEFEIEVTRKTEAEMLTTVADKPEDLVARPPVVTVMGHVDHGKTSILDAVRHAQVVDGEAGGITQHIGAYQVERDGKLITFIDTPGHAAFSAMRARGAKATDIVVLVVAADDGVMPQTKEAIDHARASEVPIIVALNKMDVPGANPDKVTQQLSEHGIIPEDWGGENLFVRVSARTGDGLEDLLATVLLQAEVLNLQANPKRDFQGTVLEASLDKGLGPVATVLIHHGTLKQGDIVLVDTFYGRVRSLVNDRSERVKEVTPGTPMQIHGLNGVPAAGDIITAVKNEKTAREIANRRRLKEREAERAQMTKLSLEDLFSQAGDKAVEQLNLLVKGDVHGSIEAVTGSLTSLSTDECVVNIVSSGVGGINENDVNLAATSNAIIIGFNVRADSKASRAATQKGVELRAYSIIYNLIDDIRQAMLGTLAPEEKEESLGWAKVNEIFPIGGIGTIAGCLIESGKAQRGCGVRLIRDGQTIYDGKLENLRRFKDDAKEVIAGQECGILLNNHNDVVIGDELELYQIITVERTEL